MDGGKIKWSRSLESKIIGDISQIDAYKNNKYQMLKEVYPTSSAKDHYCKYKNIWNQLKKNADRKNNDLNNTINQNNGIKPVT